jgi:tetratricopeptide (TPR) repeat protein/DNA-binding CsgD family transcriptional regulator
MARLYLILLICLVPLKSLCQDRPFNYREFENKVKKYIYSKPDSVKLYVEEAFKQKGLHDTIRGNLYNIYAIYYNTIGKEDSAITNFNKAIVLFKGYPRMAIRPHMNISSAYRNKGEFDKSFSHLDQALEIAKATKNKSFEGMIYGNYASNYNVMKDYNKSVEYCLRSIDILKKENEQGQLITSQQKLANNYMQMYNFEFAAEMYRDCMAGYKKMGDLSNYYGTLLNYAECLKYLNKYNEAIKALDEAIAGLKKIKNKPNLAVAYTKIASIASLQKQYKKATDNYANAFTMLAESNSVYITIIAAEYAELLNKLGRYDDALAIAERTKALSVYPNTPIADRNRLDIAQAEAFSKTDNDAAAIAGLQKAIAVKDSLNNADNEKQVREVQAKFQAQVQQEKKRTLEANGRLLLQDVKDRHTVIILCVCAAIVLIGVVLLLLLSSMLKSRLQRQQLSTAGADVSLLQERHRHEQLLSDAQRDMIDEKQRELTSNAVRMASFQNAINDIIEKCDSNVISALSDVKKELKMLIKQQDYWKQFETRFNSLHPDFTANLQHRFNKLTKNDVEFCSLLKLNLSNKEIASLLQISHESAITKKYRIKKKMEISSDEEFEELLAAI